MNFFTQFPLIAQEAEGGGGGGLFDPMMMIPMLLIGVLFYFLMLRPESKRRKELEARLGSLKKNDQVLTIGGIMGVVVNTHEKYVTLRVDDKANLRIKVLRTAIQKILSDEDSSELKASLDSAE